MCCANDCLVLILVVFVSPSSAPSCKINTGHCSFFYPTQLPKSTREIQYLRLFSQWLCLQRPLQNSEYVSSIPFFYKLMLKYSGLLSDEGYNMMAFLVRCTSQEPKDSVLQLPHQRVGRLEHFSTPTLGVELSP